MSANIEKLEAERKKLDREWRVEIIKTSAIMLTSIATALGAGIAIGYFIWPHAH